MSGTQRRSGGASPSTRNRMNETEVTKQHMEALQALAKVNLLVSDTRSLLSKLQETETEYLVSREKKVIDRIQAVFDSSQALIEQTNKNYDLITDFAKSVEIGAKFLEKVVESFEKLTNSFEEKQKLWERDIKNQEETITGLAKGLKIESLVIEGNRKSLDERNLKLNEKETKMNDERATLDRAIIRLKQGKV